MGHPQSGEYGRRQSISKCENQLRSNSFCLLTGEKWDPFRPPVRSRHQPIIEVSKFALKDNMHLSSIQCTSAEMPIIHAKKSCIDCSGSLPMSSSSSSPLVQFATLSASVKVAAAGFIRSNRRIFTTRRPQEGIDSFMDYCASDTHD